MTNSAVVSVSGLSKKYYTGADGGGVPQAQADTLQNVFTALDDVSFELVAGDVLGIIGKNGAGKSTLLKLLSGITLPTSGAITIRGRFTSILEVGTGFHPDLTGRENVFLNAGLLGMSKAATKKRFDEMVAFSEIETFIDTPVKYYSSGMYVRLATALAFHIDADVLLMDEVLSVGDESFRHKIFQKINASTLAGATVLLATHSLNDVLKFCNKCMLLEKGRIVCIGKPGEAVSKYAGSSLRQSLQAAATAGNGAITAAGHCIEEWPNDTSAPGTAHIRLRKIAVAAKGKQPVETITTNDPVMIEVQFQKLKDDCTIQLHLVVFDRLDNPVLSTTIFHNSENTALHEKFRGEQGLFRMLCEVPSHLLYKGDYTLQLRFGRNIDTEELLYKCNRFFTVHLPPGTVDYIGDALPIAIRPVLHWKYDKLAAE